jgi:hypothetical protein
MLLFESQANLSMLAMPGLLKWQRQHENRLKFFIGQITFKSYSLSENRVIFKTNTIFQVVYAFTWKIRVKKKVIFEHRTKSQELGFRS